MALPHALLSLPDIQMYISRRAPLEAESECFTERLELRADTLRRFTQPSEQ